MKRQYALSVILLAAFTASTSAQSKQDSITTKDINEVVLVSSRSPKQISDIPGTVWIIGEKSFKPR
jgi:iron complex outermembrane receptor protein